MATLTYAYSDLTAVVGPLATVAEPQQNEGGAGATVVDLKQ